ncbi:histidine phosphatase family protein [Halochromatium sp.]
MACYRAAPWQAMAKPENADLPSRLIDLLRHGEVEGGPCFRGRRDDPLNAAGWAQLEAATSIAPRPQRTDGSPALEATDEATVRTTAGPAWDRILCSPAARCAGFADQLGAQLGVPVEHWEALRERDFGAWEGLRADQIPLQDLTQFWADPSAYDPPDSEPFAAFRQRVLDGWRRVMEQPGDHRLLITHGGVIRVILGGLLGIPPQRLLLIEVPTACLSRVRLPMGCGLPSLVAHGQLASESC